MMKEGSIGCFTAFLRDQSGATAIEYGLLLALIGLFLAGAMGTVGVAVTDLFTTASDAFPSS